jgi:DNA invertase Pin-like site-specific DNA recombinase
VRPGLYQALEAAQEQRLDYLIVWSLDLLADFDEDAFEAAWHLGHAGTIPILAYEET